MIVLQHRPDIAVAAAKCFGGPVDQRRRRIVGDEAAHQFSAINLAVTGWRARRSMTFMPSSMPPPAGMRVPRTVFAPGRAAAARIEIRASPRGRQQWSSR